MEHRACKALLSRGALLSAAACALALCALALLANPQTAAAKEYSVARSDIHAVVETDGVVSVTEDRQFRFVGQSTYVYWDLSSTYGEQYEIDSVGEVGADGQLAEYGQGSLGTPGTYSVTNEWGRTLLRIHLDKADTRATFRVSYRLSGDVARHADVGELYWRFIPEDLTEGQSVSDVTCAIELPVPQGARVVLGDGGDANVMAWDHGSLDASVKAASDGSIVYTFPHVNTADSEYAEAHVVFPAAWLSDMRSDGWIQLPSVMQEESSWSFVADSVRTNALLQLLCFVGLFLAATLVCFVIFRRYGRNHRARFADEYWRDSPSADHPAVIGYVWSEGDVRPGLLATCILHLASGGYAAVSREKLPEGMATKKRGKTELVSVNAARIAELADPIDRKAAEFLALVAAGRPFFAVEDVRAFARQDPAGFRNAYNAWRQAVVDAGMRSGYIEKNHKALSIAFGIVSFIMLCASIGVLAYAMTPGIATWMAVLAGLVPLACTVGVFAMALFSNRRSHEATEIQAKCQALNRWLRDLPTLDEELPADTAFWRRLFVVSSALGTVEVALRGMRRAVPDVVGNSEFQQAFGWCYSARGRGGDVKLLGYNDLAGVLADVAAAAGCKGAGGNANELG